MLTLEPSWKCNQPYMKRFHDFYEKIRSIDSYIQKNKHTITHGNRLRRIMRTLDQVSEPNWYQSSLAGYKKVFF